MKNQVQSIGINSGFTLIELLIVIAIVAMLVALSFPNFFAARQRARDTTRKSDLKQIQKALELAKSDLNPVAYPTQSAASFPSSCGSVWSAGTNTYMSKIPCDPLGPTPYFYIRDVTDALKYTLMACLENASDPDKDTINPSPTGCPAGDATYSLKEP